VNVLTPSVMVKVSGTTVLNGRLTASHRTSPAPGLAGDSCRPSSQWYPTVTFWPSTVPVSLRPLRNAATLRAKYVHRDREKCSRDEAS
jgi:hypothetical protein